MSTTPSTPTTPHSQHPPSYEETLNSLTSTNNNQQDDDKHYSYTTPSSPLPQQQIPLSRSAKPLSQSQKQQKKSLLMLDTLKAEIDKAVTINQHADNGGVNGDGIHSNQGDVEDKMEHIESTMRTLIETQERLASMMEDLKQVAKTVAVSASNINTAISTSSSSSNTTPPSTSSSTLTSFPTFPSESPPPSHTQTPPTDKKLEKGGTVYVDPDEPTPSIRSPTPTRPSTPILFSPTTTEAADADHYYDPDFHRVSKMLESLLVEAKTAVDEPRPSMISELLVSSSDDESKPLNAKAKSDIPPKIEEVISSEEDDQSTKVSVTYNTTTTSLLLSPTIYSPTPSSPGYQDSKWVSEITSWNQNRSLASAVYVSADEFEYNPPEGAAGGGYHKHYQYYFPQEQAGQKRKLEVAKWRRRYTAGGGSNGSGGNVVRRSGSLTALDSGVVKPFVYDGTENSGSGNGRRLSLQIPVSDTAQVLLNVQVSLLFLVATSAWTLAAAASSSVFRMVSGPSTTSANNTTNSTSNANTAASRKSKSGVGSKRGQGLFDSGDDDEDEDGELEDGVETD
ncbi:hypothetical protein HDU76_004668 [Blyttiomyces sp. JEL0837]|nr:hypothetical protein HDU76_004668 [Blyttiomyces sp. JEL0837]